jgi:hypothetical protein
MKRLTLIATAVLMGAGLATSAQACSICRCGDPTFNALGKEGIAQTGLRLALDWDEVEKSQGLKGEDYSNVREQRTTLLVAYGFSDRFTVYARVPYSDRTLIEQQDGESEHLHQAGLGDPEVQAQARVWASAFDALLGVRSSVYLTLGVKTPWGQTMQRATANSSTACQPGTGSTDWFGGISGSPDQSTIGALCVGPIPSLANDGVTGTDASLLTAYERKLDSRWDAARANWRDAGHDRSTSGDLDGTGGSMLYVTPRLLFDAGGGWVVRASAQIPLSQSGLNGNQHEGTVVNVGVTRLFVPKP